MMKYTRDHIKIKTPCSVSQYSVSRLPLLLILLPLFVFSISSCTKQDPVPTPAIEVMKLPERVEVLTATGVHKNFTFEYNSEDQLTQINAPAGYYEFRYSDDKLEAVYTYLNSSAELAPYRVFRYTRDQLAQIVYCFSPENVLEVNYNSSAQTYYLSDDTYTRDFVFDDGELISFQDLYVGHTISVTSNSQKNMFYALKCSDALKVACSMTELIPDLQLLNKYLYDTVHIGSDTYTVTAEYDSDGYPTRIVWTDMYGDRDQYIISYP